MHRIVPLEIRGMNSDRYYVGTTLKSCAVLCVSIRHLSNCTNWTSEAAFPIFCVSNKERIQGPLCDQDLIIIIIIFTAIGLLLGGGGYFTCKQNMKLVKQNMNLVNKT